MPFVLRRWRPHGSLERQCVVNWHSGAVLNRMARLSLPSSLNPILASGRAPSPTDDRHPLLSCLHRLLTMQRLQILWQSGSRGTELQQQTETVSRLFQECLHHRPRGMARPEQRSGTLKRSLERFCANENSRSGPLTRNSCAAAFRRDRAYQEETPRYRALPAQQG